MRLKKNIIKSLFSKKRPANSGSGDFDIDKILNAKDPKGINACIISLDDRICQLCKWGNELSTLSAGQRSFFYIQELEREVNNGGFKQFYFNSSGNYAHEVIDSLNLIGAHKTADIVKKANDQFPNGKVPKDRDQRQQLISQVERDAEKVWEDLDNEFYKYDDDLNSLNFIFIKRRIEDFR